MLIQTVGSGLWTGAMIFLNEYHILLINFLIAKQINGIFIEKILNEELKCGAPVNI